MTIALIPALVCLVGLLMFVLSANPKVVAIGGHMFWVGLLALLLGSVGHAVVVGH